MRVRTHEWEKGVQFMCWKAAILRLQEGNQYLYDWTDDCLFPWKHAGQLWDVRQRWLELLSKHVKSKVWTHLPVLLNKKMCLNFWLVLCISAWLSVCVFFFFYQNNPKTTQTWETRSDEVALDRLQLVLFTEEVIQLSLEIIDEITLGPGQQV